ncbi:MAG TPA: preprotein translocase subunit SecE [Bacillales bacterium]|nr:preprotein translocase subunit SecE [Bacillales bacterium]
MANLINSSTKFFQNVIREMKLVSWPTGRQLASYTITVIITVAFVAVFFALIDTGISKLIRFLLQMAG